MATSLVKCRPLMSAAISIATLVAISAVLPYSVAVAEEEGPPLTWYRIWVNEGHDAAYGVASSGDSLYVAASSGEYSVGVDTFLLKYNSDGDLIWSKNWTRNQINEAHSVAVSGSGIYVAGLTGSVENLDAFLLKYDSDGNLIWSKVWGERQFYWAQNVAVSEDSVYLAGSMGSEEDYDAFLLKYDSNGNLVWSKVWARDQLNEARSVTVSGRSIYVAGWIASPDNNVEDSFLLKYDSDGNLIWGKNYESSRFGGAYSIVISGDSIYTAGVTWGIGAGFYEATLYKFPLNPISTQTASSQVVGTEGTPSAITYIVVAVPVIALIVVAVFAIRRRT